MDKLKLLIVDDAQDNRMVLRAICKKLDSFEIRDAVDGIDAIEVTQEWHPHIILMDIMMPRLDGFEASKIIKERYPQTVIIAVTAVVDAHVEKNMNAIGIDIYIHKPVDRELIRFKLQSISESLRAQSGEFSQLSMKKAINPFNSDIRSFKTVFDIVDEESIMDFGIWLYDEYFNNNKTTSMKYDKIVEVFFKLMTLGIKKDKNIAIIVEESHEEFYFALECYRDISLEKEFSKIMSGAELDFLLKANMLYARLDKPHIQKIERAKELQTQVVEQVATQEPSLSRDNTRETRAINESERELLHKSFTDKTSALEYVADVGGDIIDEILELSSIDDEWMEMLALIEQNPSVERLTNFVDGALNIYTRAINNLFEFTALAYALSSLSRFIQNNAEIICADKQKLKTLMMLLEHLGEDLKSWREHLFIIQDTADIHYLDSSFYSSCMQIEGIIMDQNLGEDDDNDMEFF